MRILRHGSTLVALGLVAACSLPSSYVQADRATFDAVAPVYSAYLTKDKDLTDDIRERRLRLIRSWGARLAEAEGK